MLSVSQLRLGSVTNSKKPKSNSIRDQSLSMRDIPILLTATALLASLTSAADIVGATLPPFPAIPAAQPVDSVPMADSRSAPEVKLDLPITPGLYAPTWASIEKNYPGTPSLAA